jgi:hypothetical protein
MRVKALCTRRGSDLRERLDSGPPEQHLADEEGADGITPLESLRNRGFQEGGHPMTDAGAVMDQTPSRLDQIWARARLGMIGPPGLEPVPMVAEPLESIVCLLRIICGPAGRERFPVLGQRGGVERVEDQQVVRQERVEQRTTRWLQTDSHGWSGTAGAPCGGPGLKRFGGVLEDAGLVLASGHVKETAIMLGI